MRWRFTTGNTTVRAVRAVDTVTHPEYRRYGVFSALTNKAVEQAKNEGVDLIFNTPNNQVLPGYLKLGWNYVSAIRPLQSLTDFGSNLGNSGDSESGNDCKTFLSASPR